MAASVNDNLDQTTSSATGRPVTATLSAPGHSIGGTSIGVSVATNWSTTTGIHFSIYATTTVGSLTVKDTSTQTDWKGTLSGTTISNMTITGGTDQDYSAGAIVEITPTARWAKDLYDWAIAQHKQDGTHANTITTDTINENTAANGVTIDGLNIKDSKLNTNNSVVTANITNNAVTSAKLQVASANSTPGSLSDIGTGYSTGATLTLAAGTYFLLARAACVTSVTQSTAFTCEIYDSTNADILDATVNTMEYVSGTQSAVAQAVNTTIDTFAGSTTVIARYKVSDSSGTSSVDNIILFAIPVGV